MALATPPSTGASTNSAPAGRRAAISSAWSGPIVDMSINVVPGSIPAVRSWSPNSTSDSASGVASIVITASTPRAVSAGESAIWALPWTASALDRVRFHTAT